MMYVTKPNDTAIYTVSECSDLIDHTLHFTDSEGNGIHMDYKSMRKINGKEEEEEVLTDK